MGLRPSASTQAAVARRRGSRLGPFLFRCCAEAVALRAEAVVFALCRAAMLTCRLWQSAVARLARFRHRSILVRANIDHRCDHPVPLLFRESAKRGFDATDERARVLYREPKRVFRRLRFGKHLMDAAQQFGLIGAVAIEAECRHFAMMDAPMP